VGPLAARLNSISNSLRLMAITGPASYLPTTDEFIAHWTDADAEFGAAITLPGPIAVGDLTTLRNDLETAQTNLIDKINDREYARGDIQLLAPALAERVEQFNARVRVAYANTHYVNALPSTPDPRASQGKVLASLDDVASIWEKIDDEEGAILLVGGYALADFTNQLSALRGYYQQYSDALSEEKLARARRNYLQEQIYPILRDYRAIIPTYFADDSPIVATLPRLTPKPGATPEPVNASAVWDEAETKARITWDASDNDDLKEYEVRYTPGDDYSEDDESVIANIPPGDPRELLTAAGLNQPGASSSFKVYVTLTTGNERGSTTMVVTRPLAE